MNDHPSDLFQRSKRNPILTAANWPYQINSVFNPGATLLADGTTLLLCRVEDRRGLSHLCAARSINGIDNWEVDPQPTQAEVLVWHWRSQKISAPSNVTA